MNNPETDDPFAPTDADIEQWVGRENKVNPIQGIANMEKEIARKRQLIQINKTAKGQKESLHALREELRTLELRLEGYRQQQEGMN